MARAEIAIRSRSYSIACAPGQQDRLAVLGARLEKRVEAIATAVGDVGEERLFLIAALSMLDELEASRSANGAGEAGTPAPNGDAERRVASALVDAAARIEAIAQRAEARNRGA